VKRAFSMIELIFAIIVISIVMLAIPALFSTSSQSLEEIIKKDAIFYSYYQLGNILTYPWDENSTQGLRTVAINANGDSELIATKASDHHYRVVAVSREINLSKNASFPLQKEGSRIDDIDDFNGYSIAINKSSKEFKLDMNLTIYVAYSDDNANYAATHLNPLQIFNTLSHSSHIKLIESNITFKGDTILVMRAFACNNGSSVIRSRSFP